MYKALLVDDEPFAIDALKLFVDWEAHGFAICGECEDGEEALRAIETLEPDVVFTDIRMPVVDGLRLIELAHERRGRRTRFVVLSGYGEFEYARSALRYGVTHYLLKPVVPEEAAEALRDIRAGLDEERAASALLRAERELRLEAELARLLEEEPGESAAELPPAAAEWERRAGGPWRVLLLECERHGEAERAAKAAASRCGFAFPLPSGGAGPAAIVCGARDEAELGSLIDAVSRELGDEREVGGGYRLAIGRPCPRLLELRDSYASALEGLRYLYFEPRHGAVVHRAETAAGSNGARPALSPAANGDERASRPDGGPLLEALERGDSARLREEAGRLREELRTSRPEPAQVAEFLGHLAYRCAIVLQLGGVDPSLWLGDWRPFLGERDRPLTLDAGVEALARFAETAAEALNRAKEERTEHPLSEADRYIRESFRETITVKGLAERLFLNPAYFGQAYQARYGIGVLERVHDLRVAEALRLIREEPSRKLSDVAETVGYAHYNHFLKQFEKRVGAKPTEVLEATEASGHSQSGGEPPVIRSL